MTLSPLVVPIGDGAQEDEVVCDPVHGFSSYRDFNPPGYSQSDPTRSVLGLHSGKVGQDAPVGGNPAMAQTFINQFVRVHGNHLVSDFRALLGTTCSEAVVERPDIVCLGAFLRRFEEARTP